jgi:Ca2+-transporting ATPase
VVSTYLVRLAQDAPENEARAFAFAVLLLGQAVLVVVERSHDRPVWRSGLRLTPTLVIVVLGTIAGLVAVIYFPPLAHLLKLHPFRPHLWLPLCAAAAVATLWFEPIKAVRTRELHHGAR